MGALDRVRQLEPIQFRYQSSLEAAQPLRAGFSAQQVQQIFPDAVVEVSGILHIDVEKLESYVQAALEEMRQQST